MYGKIMYSQAWPGIRARMLPGLILLFCASFGLSACGGKVRHRDRGSGDGGGPSAGGAGTGGEGTGGPGSGGAGASTGGASDPGGTGGEGMLYTGGGAGEGGAPSDPWTFGSEPPLDERPQPPEYELPFEVGSPGWRDSEEPVCDPHQGGMDAKGIWADERGVFALVSTSCVVPRGDFCGAVGASVYSNTGSGWQHLASAPDLSTVGWPFLGITGFRDGPLVIHGGPALVLLDPQGDAESLEFAGTQAVTHKTSLYFARTTDDPGAEVWRLDDREPTRLSGFDEPIHGLFALADGVLVGLENRVVWVDEDGSIDNVGEAPAGLYTKIWATSKDDFWVVRSSEQIARYDGEWHDVHQVAGDGMVTSLWGADDQIYYSSSFEIGVITASEVEIIARSDDYDEYSHRMQFGEVWGRSDDEVFFTYNYHFLDDYQCGGFGVLWYDGAELHRF